MEEEREFQEQRVVIKFLVKAGKRNVEIHEMMTGVYGDCLVKTCSFFKWAGRFREGTKKVKIKNQSIVDDFYRFSWNCPSRMGPSMSDC